GGRPPDRRCARRTVRWPQARRGAEAPCPATFPRQALVLWQPAAAARLEALTKPVFLYSVVVQDAEANHTGGECRPGVEDPPQPVVPHPQPPQALQPTDRPLHHPPDLPQPAAMRRLPLGDVRLDPQPPQQLPRPLAV